MHYTQTERHLGTEIEIQIVSDNPEAPQIIGELFEYCKNFEQEFSRFRENSELSKLNKNKKSQVSERFLKLLQDSLYYQEKTQGFFSPFIDISALGYSHSFDKKNFEQTASHLGHECMIEGNMVNLGENTELDFGGIGKGFLVDILCDTLKKKGYTDFCVNAGGDLYATGSFSETEPWSVGIENPFTLGDLGMFYISGKAVNTSGRYRRKWKMGTDEYHHLVNPKTQKNENEYLSVTVISESCTYGDAFTKGIWHTPFDKLLGYFQSHNLDGIVITSEGKIFASQNMVTKYGLQIFA